MKRTLSLLLACIMVMGMFGIVPVSAEGESNYKSGNIDFFYSFGDYEGTALPDGFINIEGGSRVGGVSVAKDIGGRTSTVAKVAGNKQPVLPFGTNFIDGKMHISFDYLQTNNADTLTDRMLAVYFAGNKAASGTEVAVNGDYEETSVYGDYKTGLVNEPGTWTANEYDYTKLVAGKKLSLMRAGAVNSEGDGVARTFVSRNGNQIGVKADGTINPNMATAEDTWYKVDMFIDKDTGEFDVYVNGVPQNSGYAYVAAKGTEPEKYIELEEDKKQLNLVAGNNGFTVAKGLIFECDHLRKYDGGTQYDTTREDGEVYLDNVYVSQYKAADCTNDKLKLTLDTLGETAISNGSKINLGFSEWLDRAPDQTGDIVITGPNGVVEADEYTVAADQAQATITFTQELDNGTYTVEVKNVAGMNSGSPVTNSVSFEGIGTPAAASDTAYYWANEDFNSMENGVILPNWYYGEADESVKDTNNRYYMGEASENYDTEVGTTEGADRSTALEMKSGDSNNLYYFFPRGVASGSFTAEFDIKHTNGGWTFGFVNYDDYNSAYQRIKYGRLKSNTGTASVAPVNDGIISDENVTKYTKDKMKTSILMGMAKTGHETVATGADALANRAFTPYLGMIGQENTATNNDRLTDVNNLSKFLVDTNESGSEDGSGSESESESYMKIEANQWSKVQIEVNDNSKTYTIKVTPYANGAVTQTATWKDTDANRYLKGIMGLRFTRNTGGTDSVAIDNVKVYKSRTMYLNDNFDEYAAEKVDSTLSGGDKRARVLPSGWTTWNSNMWRELRYIAAAKGVNGIASADGKDYGNDNKTDKSMYMYYGTPVIYKTLDEPVPAGKAFVMEFDVKNVGSEANQNSWMFMQMGKDDTHQLIGYNYGGGVSKNGKIFVNPADDSIQGDGGTLGGLINDTALGGYKPFADAEDLNSNESTVDETYVRINGNFMRFNVLFGRPKANTGFNYHASGRFDGLRSLNATQNGKVLKSDNTQLTDVLGKWVNYKIVCEPVDSSNTNYTIYQTYNDGTNDITTKATFANERDWFTQDTYAIGFAIPGKNNSQTNVATGANGTQVDNVKVYAAEVDKTNNTFTESGVTENYIKNITASNGKMDKDITTEEAIPVGTTTLNITFNAPISEKTDPQLPKRNTSLPAVRNDRESETYKGTFTNYFGVGADDPSVTGSDYTDYTSVLDSIKDVISVREVGSQIQSGTMSISEDKKTVTVTFSGVGLTSGSYTLGVNQNIAFSGDGYAKLGSNFVQTYAVSGDFADASGEEYTKLNATVKRGGEDIEVDAVGYLVEGELITRWITKDNPTKDPVTALVGYAFYKNYADTGARLLEKIATEPVKIPAYTPSTEGEKDATLTVPVGAESLQIFSWSYPGMKPYVDMIEINDIREAAAVK